MSSFSGKLKEYPHISVDRFDGRNLASTAYFLSHAHSDHMVGLSSPQFLDHLESNSGIYLYCSAITARFLEASIRHKPLAPYIKPLPHDETVKITIPTVANEPHHSLTVTLIPAGHCPGSVMLLLEGKGGTVLYTGDFRLSIGESSRVQALHNADGSVKTLHSLHIDTTFCHRRILTFPSRGESAQAVGDLVENWLAKGNNHLIHLLCPAKYGYEFLYRSLHDRFNMRIHVSRWKYKMYDTVPEIQENLTIDPTETWIHACDWRSDEVMGGNNNISNSDGNTEDSNNRRYLPCRTVPYGVDMEPSIRVIKPSALMFTTHQTLKEICQISEEGTFCQVLCSMHASCSEVLDMVAYLRPRKVYPNVIPSNSSKEEVLSLLHEALSQSGDHYSIEYDGQRGATGGATLGSFRRQTMSSSGSSAAAQEDSLSGPFKRQLPPPDCNANKRRRHSDSGNTRFDMPALPNPRGNIKGSMSLEGETQQPSAHNVTQSKPMNAPYLAHGYPVSSPISLLSSSKASMCANDEFSSDSMASTIPHKSIDWGSSQDSEASSVFSDDPDAGSSNRDAHNELCMNSNNVIKADIMARHNEILNRNLSRDLSITSVMSDSCQDVHYNLDNKASKRRRMWYKHHHFSTPVTEEQLQCNHFNSRVPIRSSSLPDPHTLPLTHSDIHIPPPHSPTLLTSQDVSGAAPGSPPLITISSPSTSESQVSSDDTSVTAVMSSEPSDHDLDAFNNDDANRDITRRSTLPGNNASLVKCSSLKETNHLRVLDVNTSGNECSTVSRPSVIRTAIGGDRLGIISGNINDGSTKLGSERCSAIRSTCLKTTRRTNADNFEVVSIDHAK